jgi:hypothetical protein
MGLPRKLKNINAYGANTSYLGVIGEYEEPKLALSTDDWRGAACSARSRSTRASKRWRPRSPWAATPPG